MICLQDNYAKKIDIPEAVDLSSYTLKTEADEKLFTN